MPGERSKLAVFWWCALSLVGCAVENRSLIVDSSEGGQTAMEGTDGSLTGRPSGGVSGASPAGSSGGSEASILGGMSAEIGGSGAIGGGGASGATGGGGASAATGGGGVSGANSGGGASGATVGGGGASGAIGGGGASGATSGGGGDSEACASIKAQFSAGLDGWSVLYAEPSYLVAGSQLAWSADGGNQTLGALALTTPFSSPAQKVEVGLNIPATDLSGMVLNAWVKLKAGLTSDPSNPGGAKLYVKSGETFAYADSGWRNLSQAWTKLELRIDKPGGFIQPGYSGTSIKELGVEIATGANGKQYQPADIWLDDIGCAP